MKKLIKNALTTMVGVGMISATAGMVNSMPAGTAKSVAEIVPGLQSVALVGNNLKTMKGRKMKW